jgi:hypothetical protein
VKTIRARLARAGTQGRIEHVPPALTGEHAPPASPAAVAIYIKPPTPLHTPNSVLNKLSTENVSSAPPLCTTNNQDVVFDDDHTPDAVAVRGQPVIPSKIP